MINIFGDHETDYLGLKDFSTDVNFQEGGPLTFRASERGGHPGCAPPPKKESPPTKK
jgi:hypothetical protein